MFFDLRHALRSLAKSPGFSVIALSILALCLGANLAIFAVVDAVLLRSLPFKQPEQLVSVYNSYPGLGVDRTKTSLPNYFDRNAGVAAFASVALYADSTYNFDSDGSASTVEGLRVTPEFFATLGVSFAMGQSFSQSELSLESDGVAVVTNEFWRNVLNSDREVLGRVINLDGSPVSIVGVLPQGFRFLSSRARVFRPLSHALNQREDRYRHRTLYDMIARLAPGVSVFEAQEQLNAFNAAQLSSDPYFPEIVEKDGYHSVIVSLRKDHVKAVRPVLLLLQAGALLLLIGGVNLANLLLVRASSKTKEYAVRQALGASRTRIARGTLFQTLALSLGGGLLGLLFGRLGIGLIHHLGAAHLPLGSAIVFDWRLAAASSIAATSVGILLSVPVIWIQSNYQPTPNLNAAERSGTAGRGALLLREILIVAQVGLAFMLLSSAGMLGASFQRLLTKSPGFQTASVTVGDLNLPRLNYPDNTAQISFVNRLLDSLRAQPDIAHAAVNSNLPFSGGFSSGAVAVEDTATGAVDSQHTHVQTSTAGAYWQALGIPLIEGRFLRDSDNQSGQRVCVVDEVFAQRYWPGKSALGNRLDTGSRFRPERARTIVGVVGSVKRNDLSLSPKEGSVYFPYANFINRQFSVVVRTKLPKAAAATLIRETVRELDPSLSIDYLRPMQGLIDDSLVARQAPAILAAAFSGIALILATIGTYAVLAFAVGQRRREIGVRMALGARPSQIFQQFLSLGTRFLAIGIVLGVLGAWAAGQAMRSVLFEVAPFSMPILSATAALLAIVVLLATLLPASRAAKTDPMEALRSE